MALGACLFLLGLCGGFWLYYLATNQKVKGPVDMTQIFQLTHEANDWSEYDIGGGASRFDISASAGLQGTYGVAVDQDSAISSTPAKNFTCSGTTVHQFGFLMDLNTVSLASSAEIDYIFKVSPGGSTYELEVDLIDDGAGNTKLKVWYYIDGGSSGTLTSSALGAGTIQVEIKIQRAANDSSGDGIVTLYLDSSQDAQDTGIDNYDDFGQWLIGTNTMSMDQTESGTVTGIWYVDQITFRDDGGTLFQNYSYIASANGLAKNALAVSADGNNVFIALEDNSTGNQIVFKATRPSSPTVSAIYDPGGGSAANVISTGDPDKMVFFGNFGTDVGVILHTISSDTESDISPTSIGTDEIQPLAIDPSDINHIVAVNVTDQDALETEDGSTWSTLNASLGQTVEAMGVMFFGSLFPFGAFIGGDDSVDENLEYTPNEFTNLREDTSAALQAVTKITGIDLTVS